MIQNTITSDQLRVDPIAFADAVIKRNEKGRPWTLTRYQRRVLKRAFRRTKDGRLMFRIVVWSEVKKSGKTFLAAVLGLWWAFVNPGSEVIVCANDLEQSVGRVFRTMTMLCEANPALLKYVTLRASEIPFKSRSVITAIASDYRGAAGSRHSLVIFDELWGFTSESAQRLYEELTPPPTEPNAWTLIVTYAGFTGESKLLESVYQRGLAGKRVDKELEVYEADETFVFWSHTPRQPWQTERYYSEQRRILRPSTYLRLHENRWVNSESAFIAAETWDACIEVGRTPLLPGRDSALFVGVDAGIKHDNAAVVAVWRDGHHIAVAAHRLWKPSSSTPLDLEATIEEYLRYLHARYRVSTVLCDPYQLHRSITTLKAAGLPIEEFPQTVPNTTLMGQTLFDLLNGQNLRLYSSADLREQALNTVALETPRGWRIAKEKAAKKIDAIVALALACVAALDVPVARFDAFDPMPDVDAVISTVVCGDADAPQEVDKRVLDNISNGWWFRR